MKKKKVLSKTPTIFEMKKQFLFDMIEVYNKEIDKTKRDMMRQCIYEYMLANKSFTHTCSDLQNEKGVYPVKVFFYNEKKDFEEKMDKYKVNLDQLIVVSVEANYWDKLCPITSYEYNRNLSVHQDVNRDFKRGEVWEFAILSKDRKSFVLLRDFFDKKVQPIEKCDFYGHSTIAQFIENMHQIPLAQLKYGEHRQNEKYVIKSFPNLMVEGNSDINCFYKDDLSRGVLLKDLYYKNLDIITYQRNIIMNDRTIKLEDEMKTKDEDEFFKTRETLEF